MLRPPRESGEGHKPQKENRTMRDETKGSIIGWIEGIIILVGFIIMLIALAGGKIVCSVSNPNGF
jgi:hypothetical protein